MKTYTVSVYLEDLVYGGPEEGGWYTPVGEFVRLLRVFRSEEQADEYCSRLNRKLKSRKFGPNMGRREMSSVLSDGEYWARVYEGVPPDNFRTFDHYE